MVEAEALEAGGGRGRCRRQVACTVSSLGMRLNHRKRHSSTASNSSPTARFLPRVVLNFPLPRFLVLNIPVLIIPDALELTLPLRSVDGRALLNLPLDLALGQS